jgi:hypothetical protein
MRILMILAAEAERAESDPLPASLLDWAVAPYYVFRDAGIEVVLASPAGGTLAQMAHADASKPEIRRLRQDRTALDEFSDTLRVDQVYAEDFDAAFVAGGAGSFSADARIAEIVDRLLALHRPVAFKSRQIGELLKETGTRPMFFDRTDGSPAELADALIRAVRRRQG